MQAHFHILIFIFMVFLDAARIGKRQKVSNRKKIVMFIIVMALYGGLRSPASMIDDYVTDYSLLQNISFAGIFVRYSTREPVYRCFVKILGMISSDAQFLFFVQACIVSIGFGLFVNRRSSDPLLSFLVFLSLREYSFCLAAVRQGIAIAIILGIADKYLKEKKLIPFSISVVVAALFHTSALLFIIAFPCYHYIKNNKLFIIVVSGLSAFFSIFGGVLSAVVVKLPFLDKYDSYIQSAYHHSGVQTTLIVYILILVVSLFIINDKEAEQRKEERGLTIGVGLDFCGFYYGALSRTSFYFTAYSSILLPKVLGLFKDYRLARYSLVLLLLLQYIVFGPGQGGQNYHFFWS